MATIKQRKRLKLQETTKQKQSGTSSEDTTDATTSTSEEDQDQDSPMARLKLRAAQAQAKLQAKAKAPIVRVSLDGHQAPVEYQGQVAFRDQPGSQWNNVKIEDIGKFIEVPLPKPKIREQDFDSNGIRKPKLKPKQEQEQIRIFPSLSRKGVGNPHPFIEGESPFIYYVLTPTFTRVPKAQNKQPINLQNKLSKKDREHFIGKLDKSIDKLSSFWTEQLLPTTLALESALDRVEEFTQQAADVPANLGREAIKKRFQQIVDIRLLRFAADTMGITKEEHRMLLRKLVNGPNVVQQFMVPVAQRSAGNNEVNHGRKR